MGSRQKGAKAEREYEDAYQSAGFKTERSVGQRWGRTDWFGLFDVMCVRPDRPIRFAQIKSNEAAGIRKCFEAVDRLLPADHADVEYAVRHDREGWRLMRPHADGDRLTYRTVLDERKLDCNMGEGLVAFLRDEVDR